MDYAPSPPPAAQAGVAWTRPSSKGSPRPTTLRAAPPDRQWLRKGNNIPSDILGHYDCFNYEESPRVH